MKDSGILGMASATETEGAEEKGSLCLSWLRPPVNLQGTTGPLQVPAQFRCTWEGILGIVL